MEEEKNIANEAASYAYDASDKPFDFVEADAQTALVCESEPSLREKISNALKSLGYQVTEPSSVKDALKNMRFHVYDVVLLNESFGTENPDANEVLNYLANLNMSTRRQIFVALVSSRFRTMDDMAAFNKSVNLTINTKNTDDIGTVIKRGVADNAAFYYVFKETLKKKRQI